MKLMNRDAASLAVLSMCLCAKAFIFKFLRTGQCEEPWQRQQRDSVVQPAYIAYFLCITTIVVSLLCYLEFAEHHHMHWVIQNKDIIQPV